jgi:hypothetical protein
MSACLLRLFLLPSEYAVTRLGPDEPLPEWADRAPFSSATRTSEELSVISVASSVPSEVAQEGGFRCLKVQGPLAFSEVGVLSSLAAPLAEAGVSILSVATFDTDYLLVRKGDLARTIKVLGAAGHEVSDAPGGDRSGT